MIGSAGILRIRLVSCPAAPSPTGASTAIWASSAPGSRRLVLRGSIPVGSAAVTRAVSVDNPTLFFVSALRNALIANGIDVRGTAVDVDDAAAAGGAVESKELVVYRSPPLSTLAVR